MQPVVLGAELPEALDTQHRFTANLLLRALDDTAPLPAPHLRHSTLLHDGALSMFGPMLGTHRINGRIRGGVYSDGGARIAAAPIPGQISVRQGTVFIRRAGKV
jgi:hypothetical protein